MSAPQVYTGVDIVDIERIEQAITRWGERFLRRIFTPQERADARGRAASLAARFAAKEAAAKALGTGVRGVGGGAAGAGETIGWHDIEVVRAPTGQPFLRLHRGAAARAAALGWTSTALSLSHARTSAVASVVALAHPAVVEEPKAAMVE